LRVGKSPDASGALFISPTTGYKKKIRYIMKNTTRIFSIKSRCMSFHYAFRGIFQAFRQEHNLWIQAFTAVCALVLGFLFHVSSLEWIVIVIVITGVFASELFNSAIESLVDFCTPDFNKRAGIIKDMAAGAVLITALGALAAGLIIFVPKLVALF
jgi:diacylglycerol kinase (ATP)